jgi:hypothetical protein
MVKTIGHSLMLEARANCQKVADTFKVLAALCLWEKSDGTSISQDEPVSQDEPADPRDTAAPDVPAGGRWLHTKLRDFVKLQRYTYRRRQHHLVQQRLRFTEFRPQHTNNAFDDFF